MNTKGFDLSKITHSIVDSIAPPINAPGKQTITIWTCIQTSHHERVHEAIQSHVDASSWTPSTFNRGVCERVIVHSVVDPNTPLTTVKGIQAGVRASTSVCNRMQGLASTVDHQGIDLFLGVKMCSVGEIPLFQTVGSEENVGDSNLTCAVVVCCGKNSWEVAVSGTWNTGEEPGEGIVEIACADLLDGFRKKVGERKGADDVVVVDVPVNDTVDTVEGKISSEITSL